MKCPNCGAENIAGVAFCEECGALIGDPDMVGSLIDTMDTTNKNTNTSAPVTAGEATSTATLHPGTSLQDGRYVITKVLGQGGMGAVLLAQDSRLAHKFVIIKALTTDTTDPDKIEEEVRNFKHEADLLAHLDHPLVPDVTDHFEEGSRYYMVQEYVEGENLQDRMEQAGKPMKEGAALRYISEVLDILEYLEQQNPPIVHRDIKPANIIVGTKDKRAHLVDFGIARANLATSGQYRKTTALGTPGYAPPEQYQGYTDPRSDLYALAATLHFLVTNRDPSDEAPFSFPPARTLNPRLSPEIEDVLERALQVDPSRRYQNAIDMRRDVESILHTYASNTPADSYSLHEPVSSPANPWQPHIDPADQISSYGQRQQMVQVPPMQRPPRPTPVPPYQRTNRYGGQVPTGGNSVAFNFILFIIAIILISVLAYVAFGYLHFV